MPLIEITKWFHMANIFTQSTQTVFNNFVQTGEINVGPDSEGSLKGFKIKK